jgi:hypothetical protein
MNISGNQRDIEFLNHNESMISNESVMNSCDGGNDVSMDASASAFVSANTIKPATAAHPTETEEYSNLKISQEPKNVISPQTVRRPSSTIRSIGSYIWSFLSPTSPVCEPSPSIVTNVIDDNDHVVISEPGVKNSKKIGGLHNVKKQHKKKSKKSSSPSPSSSSSSKKKKCLETTNSS